MSTNDRPSKIDQFTLYANYQSAQDTIAAQAEKIRELEGEIKTLNEYFDDVDSAHSRLMIVRDELTVENKRMRTALEFLERMTEKDEFLSDVEYRHKISAVHGIARKALNPPQAGEKGE